MLSGKDVNDLINIDRSTIMDVIIARPDCLSVVMALLKYVFRRSNVLNDLSHSAEVTGNIQNFPLCKTQAGRPRPVSRNVKHFHNTAVWGLSNSCKTTYI